VTVAATEQTPIFAQGYRRGKHWAYIVATDQLHGAYGVVVCIDGYTPAVERFVTSLEADAYYNKISEGMVEQGWTSRGKPFTMAVYPPVEKITADWVDGCVLPLIATG